jgi:hypothetical protein
MEIWNGITSAMIVRAFILAYRIMKKITETNGDTDWLKDGASHCHVRRDFFDTDRGVKKITDYVDVGDDTTGASQSY